MFRSASACGCSLWCRRRVCQIRSRSQGSWPARTALAASTIAAVPPKQYPFAPSSVATVVRVCSASCGGPGWLWPSASWTMREVYRKAVSVISAMRTGGGGSGAGVMRVGGVPQAVSEEVEREHHGRNERGRKQEPRIVAQALEVLGLLEEHPPARQRRAQPEIEERQRRLGEDHPRHRQCRDDDDVAEDLREQVPEDDPGIARPHHPRGGDKLFLPEREHFAAQLAGQPGPADDGEDHFDQPLDDLVDPAAVVARHDAEGRAEDQAEENAHQADRQRHLAADEDARQHVAALAVGPQEEHPHPRRGGPEEVEIGHERPQDRIRLPAHKEAQGNLPGPIKGERRQQRLRVDLFPQPVDIRPRLPFEMEPLGWDVEILDEALIHPVGREEVRAQRREVESHDDHPAGHGGPAPEEPPPDQLTPREPIHSEIAAARRRAREPAGERGAGARSGGGWLVGDAHWYLILGSIQASATSASRLPTISMSARNRRNVPARYMSWLVSARMNMGPVVGSESTIPRIVAPEISWGSCIPITLTRGLLA